MWEAVNGYFDTLPLAASIDGSVFCVHGGIPQELCEPGATLELIRQVRPRGVWVRVLPAASTPSAADRRLFLASVRAEAVHRCGTAPSRMGAAVARC